LILVSAFKSLGDVAGHISKLGWFAKMFVPTVFENKIAIKEN